MKAVVMILAMFLVAGMVSVTMAKDASTKSVKGTFERMDGDTMILSSTKDGQKVETPVVTDKNTKVTIDGETKTLADLTQGMRVKATTPDGIATTVIVKTKKKAPTTQPTNKAG